MARAFGFGAISVIPGMLLEFLFSGRSHDPSIFECFFIIGPVEELCKLIATVLAVGKERSFDRPADGIVYGAAAALGFAFAENLYYFSSLNTHTFIVRTGLSVPSHVLAGIPWAVALGRIKCDELAPKRIIIGGFFVASLLHGMFDALCYQIHYPRDIALLALLALTIFEWRLYMLSMVEMARLGRRLLQRRIFSRRDSKPEPLPAEAFKWRWFFLPMLACFVIASLAWLLLNSFVTRSGLLNPFHIDVALISVLMLILGIVVSYVSPGRTVRESSLALAISGFCLSFVSAWPSLDPLESGVYFAVLGAFGSWLGEMLQSNFSSHSNSAGV